jgi:hypothetical protein
MLHHSYLFARLTLPTTPCVVLHESFMVNSFSCGDPTLTDVILSFIRALIEALAEIQIKSILREL